MLRMIFASWHFQYCVQCEIFLSCFAKYCEKGITQRFFQHKLFGDYLENFQVYFVIQFAKTCLMLCFQSCMCIFVGNLWFYFHSILLILNQYFHFFKFGQILRIIWKTVCHNFVLYFLHKGNVLCENSCSDKSWKISRNNSSNLLFCTLLLRFLFYNHTTCIQTLRMQKPNYIWYFNSWVSLFVTIPVHFNYGSQIIFLKQGKSSYTVDRLQLLVSSIYKT